MAKRSRTGSQEPALQADKPFSFVPFRRALKAWHLREGRALPWRAVGDPYRVWISEIMLQQTTVVVVVPYFERFLNRFPTLQDLAAAEEQDVLKLWEGLGYYSRARNLHKSARHLVSEHGGEFPRDLALLNALPGVGRYTAGAIASFAFDLRAPILEANTLRLYSRLLGFEGDPRSTAGQTLLWKFAEDVLPVREGLGEFNQALMDLGATVCRPEPLCDVCPVQAWCRARQRGREREIPQRVRRPVVTEVLEYAVAVRRKGQYLLRQRPAGERWAGLWDFVRFDSPPSGNNSEEWVAQQVKEWAGVRVGSLVRLPDIRHSVTRFRITLQCYRAEWQSGTATGGKFAWVSTADFGEYPLSKPARRLADELRENRLEFGD